MQFGLPRAGAFRIVSDTLDYFHLNGLGRRASSLVQGPPVDL